MLQHFSRLTGASLKPSLVVLLLATTMHGAGAEERRADAERRLPFARAGDRIWTDRPVRVDRDNQPYQRIPGIRYRFTLGLRAGRGVTVTDGGSFILKGTVYLLSRVFAPPPHRLCRTDEGQRFVCGARARAYLRKTILNHYLECRSDRLGRYVRLIDCRLGNLDLAQVLVESGNVRAVAGAGLEAVEAQAVASRSGTWADPLCRAGDC
ncbi:thermonuclease family protein [Rhizobium halophytocola]|uniref:Endonuclease YncB(Thermonuclease family) n=1 Tax=Rhizobium halophytocola TaxID=735519 RepID=A0ABS4DTD7_9HYPH|nr:hypothetical protein [Rhizobium halophytocola]MBP1848946.1 endonuclease YncB(thermonuclease family) [Rhizobium halophytocola]